MKTDNPKPVIPNQRHYTRAEIGDSTEKMCEHLLEALKQHSRGARLRAVEQEFVRGAVLGGSYCDYEKEAVLRFLEGLLCRPAVAAGPRRKVVVEGQKATRAQSRNLSRITPQLIAHHQQAHRRSAASRRPRRTEDGKALRISLS